MDFQPFADVTELADEFPSLRPAGVVEISESGETSASVEVEWKFLNVVDVFDERSQCRDAREYLHDGGGVAVRQRCNCQSKSTGRNGMIKQAWCIRTRC